MLLLDKLSPYETRRVVQLGFAVVLILVLVYATTSLYLISKSTNNLTKIVEINNAKVTHLYDMRDVVRQRQILLNLMLSTKDPFLREEKSLEFFAIAGEFRKSREKLQLLVSNVPEGLLFEKLTSLIRVAQPINQNAVFAMMEEFDSDKAHLLSQQAQIAQIGTMKIMEELIALQKKYETQFVAESKQAYESVFFWSVLSAVFLIALAAVISRIVSEFVAQKNIELMQKNSELEEVSKMALEATRTKSSFLATMSHEIRTPLTAIIGYAEINLHDVVPESDRKKYSESILRNGKHLLQVINDILDISKLEADRIDFVEEKFSPIKILQEVEQIITPEVKRKDLYLELNYEFPMPEFITGDALRLKQVILNLCSNAVKFTEQGRINIKTSCNFDEQKLYVEVVDTGIGMTEDQVEKVFDAFTQADSTVSRKYGGTGLGLTLSKKFIQRMGGEIQAHSLPGIGSRFIISVSTGDISTIKTIQSKTRIPSYLKAVPGKKFIVKQVTGKILLAEDNLDNQQLYRLLLEKTGAEVKVAANGKEAVDMAMAEPFDLIFMDMQMPVMGGIEAISILRRSGYNGVIVSLTANAMKQDRQDCFEAGCNDYLTKPTSDENLYRTIYKYLDVKSDSEKLENSSSYDDPDVLEIKKNFIASLPLKLEIVKKSFKQRQLTTVKSEIHKIKGLGGSVGYPEITSLSLKIEQSLARNDLYQCESLIQQMEQLIEQVEKKNKEKENKKNTN
ncbi:MAG: response regulator [Gammaproteobacteria bacterium]|nr:response regulator [Gammaproteobacteria bacterium]